MKQTLFIFILMAAFFIYPKATIAQAQETIASDIIKNLNNGKYEDVRKNFAILYKNTVPREMIAQNWEAVLSLVGNYQKVISIKEIKDIFGNDLLKVRCEMGKENITVEITFNEDNKVIFLAFKP